MCCETYTAHYRLDMVCGALCDWRQTRSTNCSWSSAGGSRPKYFSRSASSSSWSWFRLRVHPQIWTPKPSRAALKMPAVDYSAWDLRAQRANAGRLANPGFETQITRVRSHGRHSQTLERFCLQSFGSLVLYGSRSRPRRPPPPPPWAKLQFVASQLIAMVRIVNTCMLFIVQNPRAESWFIIWRPKWSETKKVMTASKKLPVQSCSLCVA